MKRTPLLIALVLCSTVASADVFSWGVDKVTDGVAEVKSSLKKIVALVSPDGRLYPDPSDFEFVTFTTHGEITCKDRFFITEDDVKIEDARGCIIISGGDVEIDRAYDSIIIADGSITNKWKDSLIVDSLAASRSKIKFNGKIQSSTIYARSGAKIDKGEKVTAYSTPDTEVKTPADAVKHLQGKELL